MFLFDVMNWWVWLIYFPVQIGNAAYHNDSLYEQLRRSIPQLTKRLHSAEEDKTKANAAGALSNLVRNSNVLCEDIISHGTMRCVLNWIFLLWTLKKKIFRASFSQQNYEQNPQLGLAGRPPITQPQSLPQGQLNNYSFRYRLQYFLIFLDRLDSGL